MIYGYVRILKYKEDEWNLAMQKERILQMYPDAVIVEEQQGAEHPKKLHTLLNNMQPGDMVVCTKLSRFCGDLQDGLKDMEKLIHNGCTIHFLNMEIIDNMETGQTIIQQLYALEEWKRNAMKERCSAGKELARQDPAFREGRPPKYSKIQLDEAVARLADHNYSQITEETGISKSTLYRHKAKLTREEIK